MPKTSLYRILSSIVLLCIAFALTNCKLIGRKLVNGAVDGITERDEDIDLLVGDMVHNFRENALGDTTRQKIDSLIVAVSAKLRNTADSLTVSTRDSLLSEYTALRIKRIVLEAGDGLEITGRSLRDDLLGERTRSLIARLRQELLGDSTFLTIGKLRNELLGAETRARIDSILKKSITTIATGFKNELKPEIQDTLKSAGKTVGDTVNYVAWALGALGIILTVIIGFIWRKFSIRKRIMRILTQEINNIKSQEQYDELVGEIRKRTTAANLESSLREILKQENLHQQEEWTNKDRLLLKELNENIHKTLGEEEIIALHQSLEKKGLIAHLKSVQVR